LSFFAFLSFRTTLPSFVLLLLLRRALFAALVSTASAPCRRRLDPANARKAKALKENFMVANKVSNAY
jgi:hypothetical protein